MQQKKRDRPGYLTLLSEKVGINYFIFILVIFFTTKEDILNFYDIYFLFIICIFPVLLVISSFILFKRTSVFNLKALRSILHSSGFLFANITATILLLYSLSLRIGRDFYPIDYYYPTKFEIKSRGVYKGCWYNFFLFDKRYSIIRECPCDDFLISNNKGRLVIKSQQTFLKKLVILDIIYDGYPCIEQN